jgi:hypothetical protein
MGTGLRRRARTASQSASQAERDPCRLPLAGPLPPFPGVFLCIAPHLGRSLAASNVNTFNTHRGRAGRPAATSLTRKGAIIEPIESVF